MLRSIPPLSRAEWLRLSGFGGAVAFLHIAGWGLFLFYARSNPALAGLGTLAYTFGLRHAFDADHIATTRRASSCRKRGDRSASASSSRSAIRVSSSP
jgi:high-affinity nickel permease